MQEVTFQLSSHPLLHLPAPPLGGGGWGGTSPAGGGKVWWGTVKCQTVIDTKMEVATVNTEHKQPVQHFYTDVEPVSMLTIMKISTIMKMMKICTINLK
jgi:hypothetical protein